MGFNKRKIDLGVLQAIENYINHGHNPGIFVLSLLLQEHDGLIDKAKRHLKDEKHINDLIEFVDLRVPKICLGNGNVQKWIKHKGLELVDEIPIEDQVAFKLDDGDFWVKDDKYIRQYINRK